MKPELYTRVVLTRDIPEERLKKGDVATLVDYVEHPHGGEEGAILEVFNALGETLDVATVPVTAIEPLRPDHIPAVRLIEPA
jgi:hypothetical protein